MIRLRALELKDVPFMYEWMTDPEITCFFRFDAEKVTLEGCEAFVRASFQSPNTIHFAIANEADEYLGTISLKDIDLKTRQAEYAISTRKKAHGTGAALEATKQLLSYAFEELGLKRVYLNVLTENGRANAFYRKVGFKYIRTEENALELHGISKDLNWYELWKQAAVKTTQEDL